MQARAIRPHPFSIWWWWPNCLARRRIALGLVRCFRLFSSLLLASFSSSSSYRCSCPCLLCTLTASGSARIATTSPQRQQRVAVVTYRELWDETYFFIDLRKIEKIFRKKSFYILQSFFSIHKMWGKREREEHKRCII
jgi:hypothetical protein